MGGASGTPTATGAAMPGYTGAATAQAPQYAPLQTAPQSVDWSSYMSGMSMSPTTGTQGAQMVADTPMGAPGSATQSAPGKLYVPPPATPTWKIDNPKQTYPKEDAKPKYTSLGYYNTGPSSTGGRGGYAADTWGGDVYKSNKGGYFWDKEGKYAIPDSVRSRLIGLKG